MNAVVTGATRGIGLAIAQRLAQDGVRVASLARTSADYPCDLADAAQLDAAIAAVERDFGSVQILINNAAFGGPFHGIADTSDEEWQRYFATNVTAAFRLTRRWLPAMKAAGFGRIVNISSVLGLAGGPESAAYSATKHALIGLTRSTALEAAPHGVTVNAICPGFIATAMTEGRTPPRIPAGRFGTPEEVASLAAMLCRSDSGYINGATLTIDGGLLAGL